MNPSWHSQLNWPPAWLRQRPWGPHTLDEMRRTPPRVLLEATATVQLSITAEEGAAGHRERLVLLKGSDGNHDVFHVSRRIFQIIWFAFLSDKTMKMRKYQNTHFYSFFNVCLWVINH